MIVEHSILMSVTPEQLWFLLTDFEQIQRWTPSLVSDDPVSSGVPRPGFISRMTIREGEKLVGYDSEITALDEQRYLELVLQGGSLGKAPMTISYAIRPNGDQTELTYTAQWIAEDLMLKLLTPLIKRMSVNNVRKQLDDLKLIAEASSTAADST